MPAEIAQRVKKLVFGTLPDGKKAPEASSSYPSAYRGTVGYELHSKLKYNILKLQIFSLIFKPVKQNEKLKICAKNLLYFNGPTVY